MDQGGKALVEFNDELDSTLYMASSSSWFNNSSEFLVLFWNKTEENAGRWAVFIGFLDKRLYFMKRLLSHYWECIQTSLELDPLVWDLTTAREIV